MTKPCSEQRLPWRIRLGGSLVLAGRPGFSVIAVRQSLMVRQRVSGFHLTEGMSELPNNRSEERDHQ
ncbi:MAG: hypothetical protein NZ959_09915 [Armatimonadetes bacterium]|nr:hypothetical protein [Armatimonadota bacterium]MDW8122755.1 hypothetical protein [Armatimonadota bacterium]